MADLLEGYLPDHEAMHATVAIITALAVWNDVMTPLVIMSGTGQNTLRWHSLISRHSSVQTTTWRLLRTFWH